MTDDRQMQHTSGDLLDLRSDILRVEFRDSAFLVDAAVVGGGNDVVNSSVVEDEHERKQKEVAESRLSD
jgi:CobQ-like glutamine amidotransferase family enzyme